MTRKLEKENLVLFLIIALAFFVRVMGINFGLPNLYHADEPIVVHHAIAYGSGDLNPHFFNIPPLISYLVFFVYGVYYLFGFLLGTFNSTYDFLSLFLTNPSSFYLITRVCFGVMWGTATVYVLYRLAKKNFSIEVALLGALFLALNFLHVRDSHYIYADIPIVFWLVLSFFPIFKILDHNDKASYVWFGVISGIAIATKYNAIFIYAPFLYAVLKTQKKFALNSNLFLTFTITALTFLALNPFSLIDLQFFLAELVEQGRAAGKIGFSHHLSYSLLGGLNIFIFPLSVAGLALGLFIKDPKRLALIIFVLTYYLVLCFKSQAYDRYVLPMIPFCLLLAADGIIYFKNKYRINTGVFGLIIAMVLMPSVIKIYHSDRLFITPDIRDAAKDWIEGNLPENSKIALDSPFYLPRIKPTKEQLESKYLSLFNQGNHREGQKKRIEILLKEAKTKNGRRFQLYYLNADANQNFVFTQPQIPYDINKLKAEGIGYVVTAPQGRKNNFYESLGREAKLIAQFNPYYDKTILSRMDVQPLTGGPFLYRDLSNREKNGDLISIYKINN